MVGRDLRDGLSSVSCCHSEFQAFSFRDCGDGLLWFMDRVCDVQSQRTHCVGRKVPTQEDFEGIEEIPERQRREILTLQGF